MRHVRPISFRNGRRVFHPPPNNVACASAATRASGSTSRRSSTSSGARLQEVSARPLLPGKLLEMRHEIRETAVEVRQVPGAGARATRCPPWSGTPRSGRRRKGEGAWEPLNGLCYHRCVCVCGGGGRVAAACGARRRLLARLYSRVRAAPAAVRLGRCLGAIAREQPQPPPPTAQDGKCHRSSGTRNPHRFCGSLAPRQLGLRGKELYRGRPCDTVLARTVYSSQPTHGLTRTKN